MKIVKYKGFEHFADRDPKRVVKYLVIHSFALSVSKMIQTCKRLGVGPHYIIDRKGNVIQLVSENKTAWHAGKSFWRGEESLNAASVGIELQSPTLGQSEYPDVQIKALIALAKKIMKKHKILPQNVVGHSDVAPTRKADPGICFPWAKVADCGVGVWPKDGIKFVSRANNATLLKRIGYDVTDEKAALYAFMRHFMPNRVGVDKDIAHIEENLPGYIKAQKKPDDDVRQCLCRVAGAYVRQARTRVVATIQR